MKSVVYINNLEGNHHADHDVNMYDVPDYSIQLHHFLAAVEIPEN